MAKKKVRRLTPEEIIKVRAWAHAGTPLKDMAIMLGIGNPDSKRCSTFDRMIKKDPALRDALLSGRAVAHINARTALYNCAVIEKNPRLLEFYCKTQLGMSFVEKIEINGAIDVSGVSDEDLNQRTEKMMARIAQAQKRHGKPTNST